MAEILWNLLQPVDIGAKVQQGFAAGRSIVKEAQAQSALAGYLQNPTDVQAQNALGYYAPEFGMQMAGQRASEQAKRAAMEQERARVGSILTAPDPQRAAMAAGDLDLATQISKLDEDKQKVVVARTKAAAPLAYQIRQEADPARRKARLEAAKPYLLANGWTAQEIDGFDVTNNDALDAIAASGRTVDQMIDDGKIVWHQAGEQPSFATDSMGRPIGSANPYKNAVPGGPAPAAAPTAAPANIEQAKSVANVLKTALPDPVIAGFLGNFHAEGGYSGASGDGGTASGIAQWRGERQANFQRVIGKPVAQATPEEQAQFVVWEMQNPEQAGMTVEQRDRIMAAKSPGEAAALIDEYYERSSGEHRQKRVAAAHSFGRGGPVLVASKADFDKLPSGTQFTAPDGSVRVKP